MPLRISPLLAAACCALVCSAAQAADCLPGMPSYATAQADFAPDPSYLTPEGRVRIVGYNDMAEMLEPMAAYFTSLYPDIRFDLVLKGTRTAPPALREVLSLVAPMGAEWEESELAAYEAQHGQSPAMFRVAHDSLNPAALSSPTAVIVNVENPIRHISLNQIKATFTGAKPIRSWKKLGGDMVGDIHAVGLADQTAIGQFMRRHHFGNASFSADYAGKAQSRDVVAAVAADRQAIGLANLNHVNSTVRALGIVTKSGAKPVFGTADEIRAGRYPFDRHLLVYARRNASGKIDPLAKAWLDLMLSCEGQAIIAAGKLGYIPLNADEISFERAKLNSKSIEDHLVSTSNIY